MAAAPSIFKLVRRHGIWRVTFDGAFFGDYRTELQARAGIEEAQRKLAAPTRIVCAEGS